MPAPVPDFAADIWKQLSQRSRADNVYFQLTLTRYGVERLLYRLSQCPYKNRFVLKGAMLFITWDGRSPRPTRDVDFLGRGSPIARLKQRPSFRPCADRRQPRMA